MRSLKDLFENEIRSSMLFVCIGISIATAFLIGIIKYRTLEDDLRRTNDFIFEISKNALIYQEPIRLQRSIIEFWSAFHREYNLISGLEIYLEDNLVSQVGNIQESESVLIIQKKECFETQQQNICVLYHVNLIYFFTDTLLILISTSIILLSVYIIRRQKSQSYITSLLVPLEYEIKGLLDLSENFRNERFENNSVNNLNLKSEPSKISIKEIAQLSTAYKDLLNHGLKYHELEKANEVSKSLSNLSAQVAHDIRSPLSALNIAVAYLPQLEEEQKQLIIDAVQRINNIANLLLERGRKSAALQNQIDSKDQFLTSTEVVDVKSMVKSIINEKRVQFREKEGFEIITEFISAEKISIKAGKIEMSRLLSNLINNAVEAIDHNKGIIKVKVDSTSDKVNLSIEDNGKGMPQNILERLRAGVKGVSYGKSGSQSGFGIGVYHAKITIESFNGEFHIDSNENCGTIVRISLPRTEN